MPGGRQRGAAPDEKVPPAPLVLQVGLGGRRQQSPPVPREQLWGQGGDQPGLGKSQEYCLRTLIIFLRLYRDSRLGKLFPANGSLLQTVNL